MYTPATHFPRGLLFSRVSHRILLACIAIGLLLSSSIFAIPASDIQAAIPLKSAIKNPEKLQTVHQEFLKRFLKKDIKTATWVSIDQVLSLPVIQQPEDDPSYVSTKLDLITQFSTPAENGVTGLLAHNYLSGKEFYKLQIGQMVTVKYDDDIFREYQIVSINQFQKLDPTTIYSNLVDLETNKEYSSTEVFNRFYKGSHHIVFQTCLGRDGRLDWGLIFIVAEPIDRHK